MVASEEELSGVTSTLINTTTSLELYWIATFRKDLISEFRASALAVAHHQICKAEEQRYASSRSAGSFSNAEGKLSGSSELALSFPQIGVGKRDRMRCGRCEYAMTEPGGDQSQPCSSFPVDNEGRNSGALLGIFADSEGTRYSYPTRQSGSYCRGVSGITRYSHGCDAGGFPGKPGRFNLVGVDVG